LPWQLFDIEIPAPGSFLALQVSGLKVLLGNPGIDFVIDLAVPVNDSGLTFQ
jgi:hypothetical protein